MSENKGPVSDLKRARFPTVVNCIEELRMSAKNSGRQVVVERITVGLIPKAVKELNDLQQSTGMSKTDLINRAVSLYFFIENHLARGEELKLFNPKDQQEHQVHLL